MAQLLTPTNGGVQPIQTTVSTVNTQTLSEQYIAANNLEVRPTQWVPGGRPVYRRLPAVSQTYQIDFDADGAIGYVFTPWGVPTVGAGSLEVTFSTTRTDLVIQGGVIVWRQGRTTVYPALVNVENVGLVSGRYLVGYSLLFDDEPFQATYTVEDFSLSGTPLNITSSTDGVVGWRYVPVNAFVNVSPLFWANSDTLLPAYAQPTTAYLQWESELGSAYTNVTLRCPTSSAVSGTATLSYVVDGELVVASTATVSRDTSGPYFSFDISPVFHTGWNVTFSDLTVSISSIVVSGTITLLKQPDNPIPSATLVIYPENTVPKELTLAQLAVVEVDNDYQVTRVEDARYLTHRDYQPVANWITLPFDEDLIDLYEQVKGYPTLWMSPVESMKQEYASLTREDVILVS
jgi:hypothetical protein